MLCYCYSCNPPGSAGMRGSAQKRLGGLVTIMCHLHAKLWARGKANKSENGDCNPTPPHHEEAFAAALQLRSGQKCQGFMGVGLPCGILRASAMRKYPRQHSWISCSQRCRCSTEPRRPSVPAAVGDGDGIPPHGELGVPLEHPQSTTGVMPTPAPTAVTPRTPSEPYPQCRLYNSSFSTFFSPRVQTNN